MTDLYDDAFYDQINAGSLASANVIVPLYTQTIGFPSYVIDVGCGQGAWLSVWKDKAHAIVKGLDGDYVDRDRLLVEDHEFVEWDLENREIPFEMGTADLVTCLEVAEHLSPERAPSFVAELCRLAPVILFSAAVPFQGGVGHCFPGETLVSGPTARGSYSRWYEGPIVELTFASGKLLSATPNHPVLTPQGWVAAGLLHEGSDVIRCLDSEGITLLVPDDHQVPAAIEDVASTLTVTGNTLARSMPVTAEDFHGDGEGSEVAVVRSNRLLRDRVHATLAQPGRELALTGAGVGAPLLSGDRLATEGLVAPRLPLRPLNQRVDDPLPRFGGSSLGGDPVHLRSPSRHHTSVSQDATNTRATDAELLRQLDRSRTGLVEVDQVSNVHVREARHPVYNLSTKAGWYVADGIVVHNCNEQWPDYWQSKFLANGYVMSGALRWSIWDEGLVEPWYRQNLMVCVRHDHELANTPLFTAPYAAPHGVIHPVVWEHHKSLERARLEAESE